MKYTSLGSGYLYKIKDGQLVEYAGDIVINEKYAEMLSNISRGRAYFRATDLGLYSIKKFTVCVNEGEVYNGMVWLKESDICRAAKILHDYEDEKMNQLHEEFHIHSRRLDILEDVLVE